MLKKLIMLTLVALMPLSAWGIPITYKFTNNNSKVWNVVNDKQNKNDKWNFGFNGSITGEWDGSILSGITGSLLSNNGKVRVNINGGSLNKNGRGSWMLKIIKGDKTYSGNIRFKNYSYLNVSDTDLTIWGGSKLSCTKSNGNSCGRKWFGVDAKGPGSTVPGPAPFTVMGIGLVAFIVASKARKKSNESKHDLNSLHQPQLA
ncbi:MAG: hypothetical protein K0U68_11395 [Gammaproteobacteria bacterium]|nr:hypothetical protein [Gammaproteobacteria bacterium]